AGPAANDDAVTAGLENRTGCAATCAAARAPEFERLVTEKSPRSGRRPECPHLALDLRTARRPVDPLLIPVDLARVARALLRLRPGTTFGRERVDNRTRAKAGELVMQRLEIVFRRDRHAVLGKHRPGVQACIHLHDGDAGLCIAGKQRT